MICYPDICECFAPRKAVTKRTASKPRPIETVDLPPVVEPTVRTDLKAKMKAAAAGKQTVLAAPVSRGKPTPVRHEPMTNESRIISKAPVLCDEDLLLHAALRALKDVLHSDEITRWGMVATGQPSHSERTAEWKARRAWQLQQQV